MEYIKVSLGAHSLYNVIATLMILNDNYSQLDAEVYYPDKTRIVVPTVRGIPSPRNEMVCVLLV